MSNKIVEDWLNFVAFMKYMNVILACCPDHARMALPAWQREATHQVALPAGGRLGAGDCLLRLRQRQPSWRTRTPP